MRNWKDRLVRVSGHDEFHLGYQVGVVIPGIKSIEDIQEDVNLKVKQLGFSVNRRDRSSLQTVANDGVHEYQMACNRANSFKPEIRMNRGAGMPNKKPRLSKTVKCNCPWSIRFLLLTKEQHVFVAGPLDNDDSYRTFAPGLYISDYSQFSHANHDVGKSQNTFVLDEELLPEGEVTETTGNLANACPAGYINSGGAAIDAEAQLRLNRRSMESSFSDLLAMYGSNVLDSKSCCAIMETAVTGGKEALQHLLLAATNITNGRALGTNNAQQTPTASTMQLKISNPSSRIGSVAYRANRKKKAQPKCS